MFLRIGDQQFGLLQGGFFAMGCTTFRPAVGAYAPATEIAFLERYLQHLERELTDVDQRLASLDETRGAPAIEANPEAPARPAAKVG
jgi:hypothetical protein